MKLDEFKKMYERKGIEFKKTVCNICGEVLPLGYSPAGGKETCFATCVGCEKRLEDAQRDSWEEKQEKLSNYP